MSFINCSNHPSNRWGAKQIQESEKWGRIVDVPFPVVDAEADEQQIKVMAQGLVEKILRLQPSAVMCQGEFSLTYEVINVLREMNIDVYAACSERRTEEKVMPDGSSERISNFEFVRYRRYW